MKRIIESSQAPRAVGPYSQAVLAGGLLFISGQVPIDPLTGQLVEGGIEEQTHRVLRNIEAVLGGAGLTLGHVVKTTCLLTTMAHFPAMNAVYAQYFTQAMPARATYAVAGLPLGALIEIEAVATLG